MTLFYAGFYLGGAAVVGAFVAQYMGHKHRGYFGCEFVAVGVTLISALLWPYVVAMGLYHGTGTKPE